MIAVIDNYDSFTYNLVQYLGELGADLQVFRNDAITIDELAALLPEKIVISPGPGVPSDGGISSGGAGTQAHAWQDLADLSQRQRHLRWAAQSL